MFIFKCSKLNISIMVDSINFFMSVIKICFVVLLNFKILIFLVEKF